MAHSLKTRNPYDFFRFLTLYMGGGGVIRSTPPLSYTTITTSVPGGGVLATPLQLKKIIKKFFIVFFIFQIFVKTQRYDTNESEFVLVEELRDQSADLNRPTSNFSFPNILKI